MFRTKPILAVLGAASVLALGCPSGDSGSKSGGEKKGGEDHAHKNGDDHGSTSMTEGKMGTNTIEGVVTFTGTAPKRRPLRRNSDPFCAKTDMLDESVIVNDGKLQNVIVRVVEGAKGKYPKTEGFHLDQEDCMYRPRASAVVNGSMVEIKNGDETLHNVHAYEGKKTLFNKAQPPNSPPIEEKFSDGGSIIKFACDVHPWMNAWMALSDNPFFGVSGEDGTFTINKLPAGEYKLQAWHEKYGFKDATVTVKDGEPAKVEFSYSGSETAMK